MLAPPMRPLRVLVTAVGAPGTAALVRALRANGERELSLVGCDPSGRAIGRLVCDAFRQVPPGESPLFCDALLELCRRERIDAVLPRSAHDVLALAEARADFAAAGITVLVASAEAIRTASDKATCFVLLEEIGVRTPAWRRVRGGRELARAAQELGYPRRAVCLEPVSGAGSRGFSILDPGVDRLEQLLHERPRSLTLRLEEAVEILPEVGGEELLVLELAGGPERAVAGIAAGGRLLLGQATTRELLRGRLATYVETLADLATLLRLPEGVCREIPSVLSCWG